MENQNKPILSVDELSPAMRAELMKQLQEKHDEEKARITAERQVLKTITNEAVSEVFSLLRNVSDNLKEVKKTVYGRFEQVLALKQQVYGDSIDNQTNTFSSADGQMRITLGTYMIDEYDDSVNAGIEKVRAYISSLATDEKSQQLVDAVMRLMSRDQKGNLKASRVLQLSKMADRSGDKEFIDGVKIILDAYQPRPSKTFVQAKYREQENGEWFNLPLGLTEA